VLAIVLDVYSEQRKLAGKSESITETMQANWDIIKNWNRWVKVSTLIEKFEEMPRMISREEFHANFPDMPREQAERLITGAKYLASNLHAGPNHHKHTMSMAVAMKVAMDQVAEDIEQLDSGCYVHPGLDDVPGKPSWLKELAGELASQNHSFLMLQWRMQQLNWAWMALDAVHGKMPPVSDSDIGRDSADGRCSESGGGSSPSFSAAGHPISPVSLSAAAKNPVSPAVSFAGADDPGSISPLSPASKGLPTPKGSGGGLGPLLSPRSGGRSPVSPGGGGSRGGGLAAFPAGGSRGLSPVGRSGASSPPGAGGSRGGRLAAHPGRVSSPGGGSGASSPPGGGASRGGGLAADFVGGGGSSPVRRSGAPSAP